MISQRDKRFEQLYRSERDKAFAYACSFVTDPATAEDVVACSFERLYRKSEYLLLKGGRPLLYRVVRNAAIDELRRQKRQAIPTEQINSEGVTESGEQVFGELTDVLMQLDVEQRQLLALHFWCDLDNKRIGQILDISPSNVSTRLNRTIDKLRQLVTKQGAGT